MSDESERIERQSFLAPEWMDGLQGIGLLALAAVGAWATFHYGFTVSIRRFALPQWVVYGVCGVTAVSGLFLAYMGFTATDLKLSCKPCGVPLATTTTFARGAGREELIAAGTAGDVEAFAAALAGNDADGALAVVINQCTQCSATGELVILGDGDTCRRTLPPAELSAFTDALARHRASNSETSGRP